VDSATSAAVAARKLLKIGQLARRSGLPVSTIRHYLTAGLLGAPHKTARNMAYYDAAALERIALIQHLKDELFLPLKVIKKLLDASEELAPGDYRLILDVRARLAERYADLLPELECVPAQVVDELQLSAAELGAIERAGLVTPKVEHGDKHYGEADYRVLKALSAVRASGFGPDLATVDDLGIFVQSITKLVRHEVGLFVRRVGADRSPEQLIELIREGIPAVDEVVAALHHKLLLDALRLIGPDGAEQGDGPSKPPKRSAGRRERRKA